MWFLLLINGIKGFVQTIVKNSFIQLTLNIFFFENEIIHRFIAQFNTLAQLLHKYDSLYITSDNSTTNFLFWAIMVAAWSPGEFSVWGSQDSSNQGTFYVTD